MPLVSIVVPVYNAEKTLRKCLNSIISQTYKEIEVILVDDGSSDNSVIICEAYCLKNENIKLIKQKNQGPASARNKGIDNAKGKYVYFVDADDYVEEKLVEIMVGKAEENNADMVICNYFIEKNNGTSIRHEYYCKDGLYIDMDAIDLGKKIINDVSPKRIPPYSWVRLIRRECLIQSGIRYEYGMIRSEDYHFFVRLHFTMRRIYIVSKPLYHYVEWNTSITHRYIPLYWDSVKLIYNSLKEFLPKEHDINKRLDIMLLQRTMVALNNSSRAQKDEDFKKDVYEILNDADVKNIINSWNIKQGIDLFGGFYILMKFRMGWIVYMRYKLKRSRNR